MKPPGAKFICGGLLCAAGLLAGCSSDGQSIGFDNHYKDTYPVTDSSAKLPVQQTVEGDYTPLQMLGSFFVAVWYALASGNVPTKPDQF